MSANTFYFYGDIGKTIIVSQNAHLIHSSEMSEFLKYILEKCAYKLCDTLIISYIIIRNSYNNDSFKQ